MDGEWAVEFPNRNGCMGFCYLIVVGFNCHVSIMARVKVFVDFKNRGTTKMFV